MRKDLQFRVSSSVVMENKLRKSNSLEVVRLEVLGAQGVGKSAVTVRFLTKRFISEYFSGHDLFYQHTTCVKSRKCHLEIFDTTKRNTLNSVSGNNNKNNPDAYVIVYAIDDHSSFEVASEILEQLRIRAADCPVLVIANKLDLTHRRQVDTCDGEDLVRNMPKAAFFFEVSAADSFLGVDIAFQSLIREVVTAKMLAASSSLISRRLSVIAVSKMLGAVFRKRAEKHQYNRMLLLPQSQTETETEN